jgi:hypothetical protein
LDYITDLYLFDLLHHDVQHYPAMLSVIFPQGIIRNWIMAIDLSRVKKQDALRAQRKPFWQRIQPGRFFSTVRPHVKVRERGSRAPTMRDNAAITSRLSATSAPSRVVIGSLMQRMRLKRSRF